MSVSKAGTLLTVLLLCKTVCGQLLIENIPPPVMLREAEISLEEDEIGIDSLIHLSPENLTDSTRIPAAKTYSYVWNNQLVNPYGQRVSEMTDTVLIDFSRYCHPNKNVVTSDFGFRNGWRFHYGIDTRLKVGDSICSSFDGMVRIVRRGRAYGNYVVIRHFNGLETVYAHLSKTLVKVNQIVRSGEIIALGGNTGRSTGPHLHYEIRYLGQPIPPRDLINWEDYTARYRIVDMCAQYFTYVAEVEQIRYYTVRKGDTLSGISRKTGVSISKICQLNNIRKTSILRIGQRLRFT
ncbi:MAG: peptidoglycan DD-metalloendopeptidase family protein [Bacteroidales bacterium]|jgi:murein DD-endopeptidase MepM/ murein hydrolase activator NlpD|nr:peptidoglycan DD-metalloendopeptidase family protein [Bacteroidales bacterium]